MSAILLHGVETDEESMIEELLPHGRASFPTRWGALLGVVTTSAIFGAILVSGSTADVGSAHMATAPRISKRAIGAVSADGPLRGLTTSLSEECRSSLADVWKQLYLAYDAYEAACNGTDFNSTDDNGTDGAPVSEECRDAILAYTKENEQVKNFKEKKCTDEGVMHCNLTQIIAGMEYFSSECHPDACDPENLMEVHLEEEKNSGLCDPEGNCTVSISCEGHDLITRTAVLEPAEKKVYEADGSEESADQSTEGSTDESAEKSAEESSDKSTDESADESTEESVDESSAESTEKSG